MTDSSGTRSVRLGGLSVAFVLLSTCACTDCADLNVTAFAGAAAVLPCKCPSNQPPFLVWQKAVGEQQLVVNYYRKEDDVDNQTAAEYRDRSELRLTGNCSLVLYRVNHSDTGLYQCFYQKTPLRHENIYLEVTDKPTHETFRDTVTVVSSSVCGALVIVITAAAAYMGISCRKRRHMKGTFIATSTRSI